MHWMMPNDLDVLFVKLALSLIAFFGGAIVGLFSAIVFAALHYKVKSVLLLPAGAAGGFLGFLVALLYDPNRQGHPPYDFILILGPFIGACLLVGAAAWGTRIR